MPFFLRPLRGTRVGRAIAAVFDVLVIVMGVYTLYFITHIPHTFKLAF